MLGVIRTRWRSTRKPRETVRGVAFTQRKALTHDRVGVMDELVENSGENFFPDDFINMPHILKLSIII